MNQSHLYLMTIARVCGFLDLIVGWGIFFLWCLVFAVTKESCEVLMDIGALWVIIGLVVASIGLLSLFIFTIINWKVRGSNMLYCLLIILSNIPSVFIIIVFVFQIHQNILT